MVLDERGQKHNFKAKQAEKEQFFTILMFMYI